MHVVKHLLLTAATKLDSSQAVGLLCTGTLEEKMRIYSVYTYSTRIWGVFAYIGHDQPVAQKWAYTAYTYVYTMANTGNKWQIQVINDGKMSNTMRCVMNHCIMLTIT